MAWAASCARLVHTFCPWIRQPPSTFVAFVRSEARSDPDSGSEKSWHQISSPVRIGRRKRCFWASDPKRAMVGPAKSSPMVLSRSGAPARSHSSPKIARSRSSSPCPPYSRGQVSPAYPASKSIACHRRQNGAFSPRSAGSGQGSPGRLFSSHAQRSWRNRASSGASERSIVTHLLELTYGPVTRMSQQDALADHRGTILTADLDAEGDAILHAAVVPPRRLEHRRGKPDLAADGNRRGEAHLLDAVVDSACLILDPQQRLEQRR